MLSILKVKEFCDRTECVKFKILLNRKILKMHEDQKLLSVFNKAVVKSLHWEHNGWLRTQCFFIRTAKTDQTGRRLI